MEEGYGTPWMRKAKESMWGRGDDEDKKGKFN
jgi:hypothetical protein